MENLIYYVLAAVVFFIPSFLVIWLGAFVVSKIRNRSYSRSRVAASVAIAVALQFLVAIPFALSKHQAGADYYSCTIDICRTVSLWDAYGDAVGMIMLFNVLTLTAPTFILSLVVYAVFVSVASVRARVQKIV